MAKKQKIYGSKMRAIHRYLGFFLAGIMSMYAISGMVLIFRTTDFLKQEVLVEKTIKPNLDEKALGMELRIKDFKVSSTEVNILTFKEGTYNSESGQASYKVKELPFVLNNMTKLHKANTDQPLFWLNIFFGSSLLFFVISSFWMFRPETKTFKKGLYFTAGGLILTLVLLFV